MGKTQYENAGKFLKETRSKLKLTQADVSNKLKINPSFLYMIEKGTRKPRYELLVKLSEIYNIDFHNLCELYNLNEQKGYLTFTTSQGGYESARTTIPNAWVKQLGFNNKERIISMKCDGKQITIKKYKEGE